MGTPAYVFPQYSRPVNNLCASASRCTTRILYAKAVNDKCQPLTDFVSFIDGTVIGIARPRGYVRQHIAYNGHKRKHDLKFQAVNSPDGLIVHVHGHIEGRRHDWTL